MSTLQEAVLEIVRRQRNFQHLAKIPIDSNDQEVKIYWTEVFLLKAIEELVEFRKTMPSSLNKVEKNVPVLDRRRMQEEFSDVLLFLINIGIIWDFFDDTQLWEILMDVQAFNFNKLANRIAKELSNENIP